MTVPTPPAVSEAMREAVAWWFDQFFNLRPGAAKRLASYFCASSGPIASEIARLTGGWKSAEAKAGDVSEQASLWLEEADRQRSRAEAAEAETVRLRAELADAERKVEIWGDWIADSMEVLNEACMVSDRDDPPTIVTAVRNAVAALSQARADALAQGRREGLEEAKEAAERVRDDLYPILNKTRYQDYEVRRYHKYSAGLVVEDISKLLATTPAETQKPETETPL